MAFKSPVEGRSKAREPRDSSLDLSNGCRKSNLGSARSKTTLCEALLVKERASCIEKSAAFSFDEPQVYDGCIDSSAQRCQLLADAISADHSRIAGGNEGTDLNFPLCTHSG
jgi:hypothetical protein